MAFKPSIERVESSLSMRWVRGQLLAEQPVGASVVDGAKGPVGKPLGDLVRVGLIGFVPVLGFTASIADHNLVGPGREEIVKPLDLGAFLESDVDTPAHATDEVEDGFGLGREDVSSDHATILCAHRYDGGCLVNVQANILGGSFD